MPKKPKPKLVNVTAGADFEVEIDGEIYRFKCGGTSESSPVPPDQVMQDIMNCIEQKIAEASSKVRR